MAYVNPPLNRPLIASSFPKWRNVTCTLGYKHGCQSAMLEVIEVKLMSDMYFDQYLPCTKYEDDLTKTKAIIAS